MHRTSAAAATPVARGRWALLEPVRQQLTADLERLWAQGIDTDVVKNIRSEAKARRFHPNLPGYDGGGRVAL